MPKKIREIKAMLLKVGFSVDPGKGSHSKWKHPELDTYIVIARKDGDDAPRYLEKQVNAVLKSLEELKDGQE
jgi:predicted RNA binding protein YcfA (HicA-like mRNA interferase family)